MFTKYNNTTHKYIIIKAQFTVLFTDDIKLKATQDVLINNPKSEVYIDTLSGHGLAIIHVPKDNTTTLCRVYRNNSTKKGRYITFNNVDYNKFNQFMLEDIFVNLIEEQNISTRSRGFWMAMLVYYWFKMKRTKISFNSGMFDYEIDNEIITAKCKETNKVIYNASFDVLSKNVFKSLKV